MIPHPIRLRHPWETEAADGQRIVYRRRFNRPTGLESGERVTLEIDRAMMAGQVSLNATVLGELRPAEFFAVDITQILVDANELVIEADPQSRLETLPPTSSIYIVELDEPLGSPVGDVRLVIRS